MTYDLTKFSLGDMLKVSPKLRETTTTAPTLEAAAQRVCRFLYDELTDAEGNRQCALVRCYKTHEFRSLQPELQEFASAHMTGALPSSTMKCLTLMATVGQAASWNSPQLSRDHRAIPLPSAEIVNKAPMISQLIKELGLELSNLFEPSPDVVRDLAGKRHGVFFVENALGSPYIPAQKEFVIRYGISSVLGFGGVLPNGDLFAVILFSTVPVTPESADRFKSLALDVKAGFSRLGDAKIFNPVPLATSGGQRPH
ncbi:MAG: hypothetical protein ACRENK_06520 [Gemmatimonadaceae bacterium]